MWWEVVASDAWPSLRNTAPVPALGGQAVPSKSSASGRQWSRSHGALAWLLCRPLTLAFILLVPLSAFRKASPFFPHLKTFPLPYWNVFRTFPFLHVFGTEKGDFSTCLVPIQNIINYFLTVFQLCPSPISKLFLKFTFSSSFTLCFFPPIFACKPGVCMPLTFWKYRFTGCKVQLSSMSWLCLFLEGLGSARPPELRPLGWLLLPVRKAQLPSSSHRPSTG